MNNNVKLGLIVALSLLMVTLIGNAQVSQGTDTPCECPQPETPQQNILDRLSSFPNPESNAQEETPVQKQQPRMEELLHDDDKDDELCDTLTPEQLLPPYPQQLPCLHRRVPRSELPRCTNATQILRGGWDSTKTWFEPDGCNIKRFSKEEATACFAGKTIGFVGDSTIINLWRQTRLVFGDESYLFGELFDEAELKKTRKPGDPRLSFLTTFYNEEHQFLFRFYSLWQMQMFNETGHGGRDNGNHTIVSVLQNRTHDAVFINLGAHHQNRQILEGLTPMTQFYSSLDSLVRSGESVPLVYISTNAQIAEKKTKEVSKHQTYRLSRVLNELAHWSFEVRKPQVVPMLDFSYMIEKGFPWSSHDGIHSVVEVDYMKWQILLNFMCKEDGFTTTINN